MCTGTAVKDHLQALVKVPEFDGCDIVYGKKKTKTNTMSWATLSRTLQEGPLWQENVIGG